jgi:FAD synthetase
LLILYLAALHEHHRKQPRRPSSSFPTTIPAIYAKPPDPFPAVSSFVEYSSRLYRLDLVHVSTNPGPKPRERSHSNPPPPPTGPPSEANGEKKVSFRDAFALYLSAHPAIKAIFVGTRRTDPHGGHLTHFDPTDHHWPSFMRIHPVIDWHLSEIWCFLRSPHLKDLDTGGPLKYCPMYDEGYTSLGGVHDTMKNPQLKVVDGHGRERYRPAHEMTQDEGERLGRE